MTDENAVEAFAARFAAVSALVNSAGMILHEAKEFTPAGFRRVIDVNLVGTELVTLALRTALAAARGSVVNLASMFSFFGSARNPAYAASKASSNSLVARGGVRAAGIRVNAVAPGWIDTRLAGAISNPSAVRHHGAAADGTMGHAGRCADVVAFLHSEDAVT